MRKAKTIWPADAHARALTRGLGVVAFVVAVAGGAHAQEALGDPVSVHGVEVRGLLTSTDGRAPPHIQHRGRVRVSILSGRSTTSPGARRTTLRLCEADALRTEVAMPGVASTRVTIPGHSDDPSAHLIVPARAAMTYVRVEIPRTDGARTRWVSIEWAVPTARRAAMRALEDAFFASIRCVS